MVKDQTELWESILIELNNSLPGQGVLYVFVLEEKKKKKTGSSWIIEEACWGWG